MGIYSVADFNIKIDSDLVHHALDRFEIKEPDKVLPDICLSVSDDELMSVRCSSSGSFPESTIEFVALCLKLGYMLPQHGALLFHSSVISAFGHGIAFAAKSGTGKSTHTALWRKQFGDEVKIINGDKPIIRFRDGNPYAYGTPWAGKEGYTSNSSVRLTDICVINRSNVNRTVRIEPESCLKVIMDSVLRPSDINGLEKVLELTDRLVSSCRIWRIDCNISDEAAIVAKKAIIDL